MGTPLFDTIAKTLLNAESVFYKEGLPESEYVHALADIHQSLNDMGTNHWKYGNLLKNMAVRLEEMGAFELGGHDEALAELSRLLPISFHTINRLVLTSFERHELIAELVDSLLSQVFDITEVEEPKFLSCLTNLSERCHEVECAKILDMLLHTADERFNELKTQCFYSVLLNIGPSDRYQISLKKWFVDNSADILKAKWFPSLISRLTMKTGINLHERKLVTLGEAIMRSSARSAGGDDLILREQLTGITVSQSELRRPNGISDIPLMSYLCWTSNPAFDFSIVKGLSFKGTLLTDAIRIASDHIGNKKSSTNINIGMIDGIKAIALNTSPRSGLTDILDRQFLPNRVAHDAFIKTALITALGRYHDEMTSIFIVSKIMERHHIALDTSAIAETLNKELVNEVVQQRNMSKYFVMFNASFISLFSEDIVILCLEQASAKASRLDIACSLEVIPEDMVMKVGGLKRAMLSKDLGI